MSKIRASVGDASWAIPRGLGRFAYDLAIELSGERKPRILISQIYDRPGSGGPHDDTSPDLAAECLSELAGVDLGLRVCDIVDVKRDVVVVRVPFPGHIPVSHASPDRAELWYGSLKLLRDTPEHRVPFRSIIDGGSEFVQAAVVGTPELVVMRAVGPDEQSDEVLASVREYAAAPEAADQMHDWYRVERGAEHRAPELQAVCERGVVTPTRVESENGVVPHVRIDRATVSVREHYDHLIDVLFEVFNHAVAERLSVRWGVERNDGS
ncbi:hypothetical protein FHP29_06190 [Nocardioides albidus]|uniref:Uncharacterized protein n=1 Tax=Nocardioides albidus TaxID=1517589 RepID=A0A5C4W5E3_9ACTN|nr:hypothetical protein [Nocardioides albidus]TNM43282.1 hypothetical protein FHP29_06190 [Nocardioides albidus]